MVKRKQKILALASIATFFTLSTIGLVLASKPLSLNGKASGETAPFSISLTKDNAESYSSVANSTYSSHFDNTASFKTSQGNGMTVSVINSTTSISSSSNLGNLYAESSLSVSSEYATAGKSFQKINSITITSVSTAARTARLYFNGNDSYESLSVPARDSATFDATALGYNIRSFVIKGSSANETMTIAITSIVINYACSSDYSDDAILSSLSVDASGAKTQYTVGETFSSTGIVLTATYSDLSQAVVSPTTISSPDMSTTGEKTITVSYTEGGVTKETSYQITVSEAPSGLTGTYTSTSWTLEFTSPTTGTYSYYDSTLVFSYVLEGNNLSLTYVSGAKNTDFGSNRLFSGGDTPNVNTTGIVLSATQISLKTYNMFDIAQDRTFTK